jgi:hypothetical protein
LTIIQDCLAGGNPRFSHDAKALNGPTNDVINFTKIARKQIATLRKWRVPDVRAGPKWLDAGERRAQETGN